MHVLYCLHERWRHRLGLNCEIFGVSFCIIQDKVDGDRAFDVPRAQPVASMFTGITSVCREHVVCLRLYQ